MPLMSNTLDRVIRSTRPPRAGRGAGPLLALVLCACSAGGPAEAGEPIDRETFIATFVDLRATALRSDERVLSDDARAEVLERHGVTAEDLLRFADAYGRDVELMRDVWNEVEVQLDAMQEDEAR